MRKSLLPSALLLVWLCLHAVPALAQSAQEATPAQASSCTAAITSVQVAMAGPDPTRRPEHGWQPTTLPDYWHHRWPGYDGGAWYRIDWTNHCPPHARPQPVALLARWISLAGEVHAGDDLIWRDRHMVEPLSRSWNSPRYWILPGTPTHAEAQTLWVRVASVSGQAAGIGLLHFGSPEAMHDLHADLVWKNRTLMQLSMMATAVFGLLALCLWLYRRSDAPALWYALQAGLWALFCATVLTREAWPFADTMGVARASNITALLYIACFSMFAWRFSHRRLPRNERLLWLWTGLLVLASLIVPSAWLSPVLTLSGLGCIAVFLGVSTQIIWNALRNSDFEQRLFALCQPVFIAAVVHDALKMQGHWIDNIPLTPLAALASAITTSWLLGRRAALNARRVERFGEEQRIAVEQACNELSATLEHEHALKLANSRLQERLHFVHDLHDSLGGQISRSIMQAEREGLQATHPRTLSALKLLRDDLRQIIDGDSGGVPATPSEWIAPLRHRFGDLLDELGITVTWQIPPAWRQPPPRLHCLALGRLLEEALTNIAKHSRAHHASVELHLPGDGSLHLHIQDDGIGFDPDATRQAGQSVGMQSMHERMQRLGGSLLIQSKPGCTRLHAELHAAEA